jgi:hypothetical protein
MLRNTECCDRSGVVDTAVNALPLDLVSSLGCDVMLHTSTSRTLLSDHRNASNKNLRPMFVLDFKNMTNLLRAKELAYSDPTDMVIHNAGPMSQWASRTT